MNEKTFRALDYYKILDKLSQFASGTRAKADILALRPLSGVDIINAELDAVSEADAILYKYAVTPSLGLDDISDALGSSKVFGMLSMAEIMKVGRVLRVSRNLQLQLLKVPDDGIVIIKDLARKIYVNKRLEDDIDRSFVSETEMSDNASPELRALRQKIRKMGEAIKSKLNSFVTSPSYVKYMQDNIVTIREDRYVIPLKAEYKGAIPGLIHDQSASGATLYVEPFVIVDMNNDLKQLLLEEQAEINRILRAFTAKIGSEAGFIEYTFDIVTRLDVLFAKAVYANSIKAVRPVFNDKGYVHIERGRHPLIHKDKVVPNTVTLGGDYTMLLITGPNTGGKTVCLKLIGLLELMGKTGLFVPADVAELADFQQIYSDIGDEQSIEQNLSTFSAHMSNVTNIIDNLTPDTLVLFDELGAGTDPTEGASLALSIASYILKVGARAVITTHYNEFKEFAVTTDGVENASMDFDPTTYSPTYKLIIGTPGASNALLIAERLGLKEEIINRARLGIGSSKREFEKVLLALEGSRKEADVNLEESKKKLAEAEEIKREAEKEREKLFMQREKLNVNIRKETKRLVEEAMEEANDIIEELRSLLDDPTEANIFRAQKLRKSLKKYVVNEENELQGFGEEQEGEIVKGDRVLVKSLRSEGEVLDINAAKKEAKIKLGRITSSFPLSGLQRLTPQKKKQERKPAPSGAVLFNETVSPVLNIIGKTSLEAEHELAGFVDRCLRARLHEIQIIHGYGEGILRRMVQEYLSKRPEVESFRLGNFNEGGKGVTFAYLK
ncbi:MAG: endonuclease MutS2 [Clostridia bacterium]|nr:endonuclease MutS2 [Clostridia bacterium]